MDRHSLTARIVNSQKLDARRIANHIFGSRNFTHFFLIMVASLIWSISFTATATDSIDDWLSVVVRDPLAQGHETDLERIRSDYSNLNDALTMRLSKLPSRSVERVALALGGFDAENSLVIPTLINWLSNHDSRVRAQAAASLARIGTLAITPTLDSLDTGDIVVDKEVRVGRHGQTTPRKSDYVAWVLINGRGDCGSLLLDWLKRTRERATQQLKDKNDIESNSKGFDPYSPRQFYDSDDAPNVINSESKAIQFVQYVLALRGNSSVNIVLKLLENDDPALRALGLNVARELGADAIEALPAIAQLIDAVPEDMSTGIVYVVGDMGPEGQIYLRSWLARLSSHVARIAIVRELDRSDQSVSALLRTVVEDANDGVRIAAVKRLSEFQPMPLIIRQSFADIAVSDAFGPFRDTSNELRAAAIGALDDSDLAIESLLQLITNNTDRIVKNAALDRISQMEHIPPKVADALKAFLSSRDFELTERALRALLKIDNSGGELNSVVPSLIRLLDNPVVAEKSKNAFFNTDNTTESVLQLINKLGNNAEATFETLMAQAKTRDLTDYSQHKDAVEFIKSAIAVRPLSAHIPSELLGRIVETARLSQMEYVISTISPGYENKAELVKTLILELRIGLYRKRLQEMQPHKSPFGVSRRRMLSDFDFDDNEYDYFQPRDTQRTDHSGAVQAAVFAIGQTGPAGIAKLHAFFDVFQPQYSTFGNEICDGLTAAANQSSSVNRVMDNVSEIPLSISNVWHDSRCHPRFKTRFPVDKQKFILQINAALTIERPEEYERKEIVERFFNLILQHASDVDDLLDAIVIDPDIPLSGNLLSKFRNLIIRDQAVWLRFSQNIPKLSWRKSAEIVQWIASLDKTTSDKVSVEFQEAPLPPLPNASDIAAQLLEKVFHMDNEFTIWQATDSTTAETTVYSLLNWLARTRRIDDIAPVVSKLLNSPLQPVRLAAVRFCEDHMELAIHLTNELKLLIQDSDHKIASRAADILVQVGTDDADWDYVSSVAIAEKIDSLVDRFLDTTADRFRPSTLMSATIYRNALPPFPLPPPRYTLLATFGRDVHRELVGKDDDTLGVVQARLVSALNSIDSNFDSRLFSAPGGFAMMTKQHQIDEQGRPVANPYLWRPERRPPTSLSDYLVTLFLAPPGYYRMIAFVFTDEAIIGYGSEELPDFESGGTELPPDIADLKLGGRHAYAVVYAFARKGSGVPRPYKDLSAKVHLERSGILSALEK